MKILNYNDADFEDQVATMRSGTTIREEIYDDVARIIAGVRDKGDAAVSDYARTFDNVELAADEFLLNEQEINAATARIPDAAKAAIRTAHENISAFARERLPKTWTFTPRDGVILGERFQPLSRIGAYIPGGSAPLVSTVIHTISMAGVAGVPQIAVVTPAAPDKTVNPAIVYAATIAGATEIYRLGGVYAIAALAFGTASVRRVEKIVGPGNDYVQAAKQLVYGQVALDMVAGPSEVLIIADDSANAAYIAADLLAQAEHGSGHEKAVLLTTSDSLIDAVRSEVQRQTAQLQRRECIRQVIDNGMFLIRVKDLRQATIIASEYAPEHLEIMTSHPEDTAEEITAAGAIFLGQWTPEPVGDFVAGPSHVLPTGGSARYFSGLTVDQFCRRTSLVRYDKAALEAEAAAIAAFAQMEQLDAHGRSVSIRFDNG